METGGKPVRILLISMPLADPALPNLAIEQLAEIARDLGIHCDVLYGTLLLPKIVSWRIIHGLPGPAIFSPAYYGVSKESVAEDISDLLGQLGARAGMDPEACRDDSFMDYSLAIDAADQCLGDCLKRIPVGQYSIVGFSVGFDAQKLPSAALAKLLKKREPTVQILFGGTACDGDMGAATLESFSEVDAILQGESEDTFVPAVRMLLQDTGPSELPGLLFRDGKVIRLPVRPPHPPAIAGRPVPDYTQYMEQRRESAYAKSERILFFETSRGCWYGFKQHCRFCGIANVDQEYRQRPPTEAVAQVVGLSARFQPDVLYATDSILSLTHLRQVMPALAKYRREGAISADLFYEIKSNLRREQVAMLAAAGVRRVQPGIESFITASLRRMNKGATGLHQVCFLKWVQAYGIFPIYGLLVGVPGETNGERAEMASLMAHLHHLPPPSQVNKLGLHKFSPFAADPDRYGLVNVRPFKAQKIIYNNADDGLLQRLCYELDYDLAPEFAGDGPPDFSMVEAELHRWHLAYVQGGRLGIIDVGPASVVLRTSVDGLREFHPLTPIESLVCKHAAHVNTLASICEKLGEPAEAVHSCVVDLERRGFLARDGDSILALPVPMDADVWQDSGADVVSTS